MSFLNRAIRSNFLIKLRSWEYWPFGIVQFPLFIYFAWLSLKSRSFFFFSASNPGIEMGGMFGESKFNLLKKIPPQYTPRAFRMSFKSKADDVVHVMATQAFQMPVIFKPDLGERGFMVRIIRTKGDIEKYLSEIKVDFIIQELVQLPLEFGVFYTRFPSQLNGAVTSVVMKEMLSVVGDGVSTLEMLILAHDRAKLQLEKLKLDFADKLSTILPSNQKLELVPIGNHCLGTKFLNGNHLINEKLSATFDQISKQVDGFYFGRFDLRCASVEDLYNGHIMIMELNGCGAEPAHIYQPGYSLFKALSELFTHWQNIYKIAHENKLRGSQFLTLSEGYQYYKAFKSAVQ